MRNTLPRWASSFKIDTSCRVCSRSGKFKQAWLSSRSIADFKFQVSRNIENMTITKELLEKLFEEAKVNPRLRTNLDLRTSAEDGSQRMLNAMLPGTEVAIHRHPMSNENVILIKGRLDEVLYEEVTSGDGKTSLKETERIHLSPEEGVYGCQVSKGVWHTVEVIEPSVIYEGKDGKYGEDGSETYASM